jgi:DNA helicase-2/ATP-dependent DNA helicase PcrA
MAVLYRSHFHALELQLEFTRRNIPFSITSGIRFFEQAHIKDVASYLKLVVNPQDELAFKRLAQMLPGIGGKAAQKLWTVFSAETSPVPEEKRRSIAAALQKCADVVPKKGGKAWIDLTITISQLEEESVRSKPAEIIRHVLEAGYEEYLQDNYTNYRTRLEDLQQLATFALQFTSTEEFLTQLSLLTNLEAEDDRPATTDTELIRLSTIHQAKGLEFDVVFVIMLCDGLFPSSRSMETVEELEEERRLFYVAITRARDELYLSYPLVRVTPGYAGDSMQTPSRFLGEFPNELVEEWNLRSYSPYA